MNEATNPSQKTALFGEPRAGFLRTQLKARPQIGAAVVVGLAWCAALLLAIVEMTVTPLRRLRSGGRLIDAISNLRRGLLLSHSDMTRVLEDFLKLEELPTIRNGMQELEMFSLIEWQWRRQAITTKSSNLVAPLQRPYVFFPGLPARTFYDPDQFQFTQLLEAGYSEIKQELLELLNNEQSFKPYRNELGLYKTPFLREEDPRVSTYDKGDWNVFYFWSGGQKHHDNCRRCPRTTEILMSIPGLEKYMVCFSLLKGRSRIPAHYGPFNGILRVHLPLIVPEGCGIRVGNDERTWDEGKVMVFDDSFRHEVWNPSDQIRVVLFINVFHPQWNARERQVLENFVGGLFDRLPLFQLWQKYQTSRESNGN